MNMILILSIIITTLIIKIFFGRLRMSEQQHVTSNAKQRLFHLIWIFLILSRTISYSHFLILLFIACLVILHWITQKRIEYIFAEDNRRILVHAKIFII